MRFLLPNPVFQMSDQEISASWGFPAPPNTSQGFGLYLWDLEHTSHTKAESLGTRCWVWDVWTVCMEVMGTGTVALGSEGVFPSQTKETEICGSSLGSAHRRVPCCRSAWDWDWGTGNLERALPKPRAAAVLWGFAKANTGVLGLVGPTWDWESESDFWFGLLGFNSEKL